MEHASISENDYVRHVLVAYRRTPTTAGRVHRQDRLFAAQLYRRGISLTVVENALLLGAVRRLYRDLDRPPLAPVRSLHYFSSLIEEVLSLEINPGYFQYLRQKVDTGSRRNVVFAYEPATEKAARPVWKRENRVN